MYVFKWWLFGFYFANEIPIETCCFIRQLLSELLIRENNEIAIKNLSKKL